MSQAKPADANPAAKLLSRKTVFEDYHRVEVMRVQPRSLRNGGWAEEMEREIWFGKQIACILLYRPETDELLLNQQFRLGAMMAGAEDPFLFENAAGAVDEGESVEDAARRETLEETGCEVLDMEFFGKVYSSPGCMAEEYHMFVARIGAEATAGIHGHFHEGEEIKTHILPVKAAMKMLDDGHIVNVATALSLNWFARNHDRLRNKWSQK
ncbi:MAG: NUDIX domain-containing protein [Micavibrio sp.]|nr:NUDIX domain-containing protein [Micavibrio sp.]